MLVVHLYKQKKCFVTSIKNLKSNNDNSRDFFLRLLVLFASVVHSILVKTNKSHSTREISRFLF